jgi:hypothetical protein
MQTSDTIADLAAALAAAQGEIENAVKNSANPHFRSKYADLAEIINTVRPVFARHGLAVVQSPSYDGGIASVTTMLTHKSGQWIRDTASAPASKLDSQGIGSATTYLRRYSLAAFAGIAQEDDDGNAASRKPAAAAQVDEQRLLDYVAAIEEAPSSDDLQRLYKAAYEMCAGNQAWQQRIINAKKARVERAKQEKPQ